MGWPPDTDEEERTVRYLLGKLPEPEQVRLEERFFEDDDRYEQMLAIEDELMYTYLQGELSSEDRALFEERLMNAPAARRHARFAAALLRAAREEPPQGATLAELPRVVSRWTSWPSRRKIALALQAAILVLASASGWMAYEAIHLRREGEQLLEAQLTQDREFQRAADGDRASRSEIARELEAARRARVELEHVVADARRAGSRTVVSLILTSGLHRGEDGSGRFVVPPTAVLLRLQLDTGKRSEYPSYRAMIRTAEGDQVWGQDGLRPSVRGSVAAVVVEIPAKVLLTGDYELILSGLTPAGKPEDVGDYSFGIVRR